MDERWRLPPSFLVVGWLCDLQQVGAISSGGYTLDIEIDAYNV